MVVYCIIHLYSSLKTSHIDTIYTKNKKLYAKKMILAHPNFMLIFLPTINDRYLFRKMTLF